MRSRIWMSIKSVDKAALSFVVVASISGLCFVFMTPLFWGNDERDHFARAYNIMAGDVFAENIDQEKDTIAGYKGYLPKPVANCIKGVYEALTDDTVNYKGEHSAARQKVYGRCRDTPLRGDGILYQFPVAAAYSPLNYAPAVSGLAVAQATHLKLEGTLRLMRGIGLLFYIACVSLGILSLRKSKLKWLVVAVGLVPTAIFQASVVSADTITNATCLLFFSLYLKTYVVSKKLSKLHSVLLLVTALAIPQLKPAYAVFAILILFVPASRFAWPRIMSWLKPLVVLAAFVLMFVWAGPTASLSNAVKLTNNPKTATHIHPDKQTDRIISQPLGYIDAIGRSILISDDRYINGLFGGFGMLELRAPTIAITMTVAAIVLAAMGAERVRLKRYQLIVLVGVVIGGIVAVFTSLYITFTPVGSQVIAGVQGRYFIPFIMPVMIIWVASAIRLKVTKKSYWMIPVCIICLCSLSLLLTLLKYAVMV